MAVTPQEKDDVVTKAEAAWLRKTQDLQQSWNFEVNKDDMKIAFEALFDTIEALDLRASLPTGSIKTGAYDKHLCNMMECLAKHLAEYRTGP